METVPQKPELPKFPTDEQLNVNNNAKVDILIKYIELFIKINVNIIGDVFEFVI